VFSRGMDSLSIQETGLLTLSVSFQELSLPRICGCVIRASIGRVEL
jgi:hypothetical protein